VTSPSIESTPASHSAETAAGARFRFGQNWSRFLRHLTPERVAAAESSMRELLETQTLAGTRFLDAGSGSGLFSLAANRLGATVHSFDYDPQSVACTTELRARYARNAEAWTVEEASVLDAAYVERLGKFDVVYSWGVLHHTGNMHKAFDNIEKCVGENGQLVIAIYNHQGAISRYWTVIKKLYNRHVWLRPFIVALHTPYLIGVRFLARALTGRLALERGMSLWYDTLDWLGGYPFEVARPEEVVAHFKRYGFWLEGLHTCGGRHGCNEFVFRRGGGGPA
jgi:2-polyprenyl-3-methyl-5-hydroxy-6-metoxy-1,4-benzoquinol methylase